MIQYNSTVQRYCIVGVMKVCTVLHFAGQTPVSAFVHDSLAVLVRGIIKPKSTFRVTLNAFFIELCFQLSNQFSTD